LNEGAWREVRVWEGMFSQGLAQGWKRASTGDKGLEEAAEAGEEPSLMKFQGRPKDLTPKAAIQQALGWLYPSKYEYVTTSSFTYASPNLITRTNPPFDRHDWYVQRVHNGQTKEIRYVIDYYEAPDDENGDPVFNLDVRPAVDSPILAMERIARWGGQVWYKASGAETRQTQ
jgi:cytochrome c heme-lyase